jgi:hypothetical protein
MVLGILWVPLISIWEHGYKRSHGFGNTVGYLECLHGNMVTKDPQRSHGFENSVLFYLECPWEHGYERSHGFGNFVVFNWNVHGNMVTNDFKVLKFFCRKVGNQSANLTPIH